MTHTTTRHLRIHWAIFVLVALGVTVLLLQQIKTAYNVSFSLSNSHAASVPTLFVPLNTSIGNGQTGAVDISIDTAGMAADGIDVSYLHFNPSILQVVDDDSSAAGVQITPGNLFAASQSLVDNTAGTIFLSQFSSAQSHFTGTGALATIHFRAISTGTSALTFDFTAGNNADSNIANPSGDILAAVVNGTVTVTTPDTTSPTVSITSPTAGSTVSGSSVAIVATASDNVGVVGVQFKLDGTNLGAEDTSSPYSATWDTAGATNTSHTLTAIARDAAGNTTTSSSITVTVNNFVNQVPVGSLEQIDASGNIIGYSYDPDTSSSVNQVKIYIDGTNTTGTLLGTPSANIDRPDVRSTSGITGNHGFSFAIPGTYLNGAYHTINVYGIDTSNGTITSLLSNAGKPFTSRSLVVDPEGRSSKIVSGKVSFLNSSKSLVKDIPFTSDTSGNALVTIDASSQSGFFKFVVAPFLTRLVAVNLTQNTLGPVLSGRLLSGDINSDNIINSVDFSILNSGWFSFSSTADLNKDGVVNSLDWSLMNSHWLVQGEQ